ncbi:unnamed protein product [Rotaria sordida]|uniref:Uncharacterized protein n=1 Tax=Rotaria sordida TaxID=392033 RepID=A0A815W344_9BILA|nr:unnamed protein product [Rotaria sordida]
MLCIFFIVQGTCGLFIVFIHTCAIVFNWTSAKMAELPPEQRYFLWLVTAFTHLVTIFCIIWFFIGHIWFIQELGIDFHYIVGICMIYDRIQYSRRVLHPFEKKIHHYLQQSSENDKCLDAKEKTENQKNVGDNANINQLLMNI